MTIGRMFAEMIRL